MTRIAVSANSLVDYSPERWRLIELDSLGEPKLLLEAKRGLPLRFSGAFAVSRDLPASGEILPADLGQVVLGWSQASTSWQLGVTLSEEISLARSSRWFEVLRMSADDPATHESSARQLAQSLAATLGAPFIARDESAEAPPPMPQPAPLAPLPLDLGVWRLEEGEAKGELRLVRGGGWMRSRRRQMAWHGLWAVIYAAVALATLNSELGLPNAGTLIPNPDWLPYLALFVAGMLALMVARQVWLVIRLPDTIVFSAGSKVIRGLRGTAQRWQIDAATVQSVYVSEIVKPGGRKRLPPFGNTPATFQHGEINLQSSDGRFANVLLDTDKREHALLPGADEDAERQRDEGLGALEAEEASAALQMAGLHIAKALGDLPVWHDRRRK